MAEVSGVAKTEEAHVLMIGMELWASWPDWIKYIYLGVVWMVYICATGAILARLGFKPLWALTIVLPILMIVMYWVIAYRTWPREKMTVVVPGPSSGAAVG